MNINVNRRDALSALSLTGLVASTDAATATAAAPGGTSGAAEEHLVEAGRKLDDLTVRFAAADERSVALDERWFDAMEKRGLDLAHDWAACWELARELDRNEPVEQQYALAAEGDAVSRAIWAMPPQSVRGLAAWAKMVRWAFWPAGDEADTPLEEMDLEHACLRRFLLEVERLANAESAAAV